MTSDPWVLSIIRQGYQLTIVKTPPLSLRPLETPLRGLHKEHLETAVRELLAKAAIAPVLDWAESPGFYSPYFLTSKKDGSLRPILNLKHFNSFLAEEKFRMDTLVNILSTLHLGDWMFAVDLKDAYLHVPIHPAFHKYLRFAYRDSLGTLKVFQWQVLPFGLNASPRVFTKVLAPVAAYIHRHGHRLNPYIDDLLGAAHTRLLAQSACHLVVDTLLSLGFMINIKKSHLVPTQLLVHLGAHINTLTARVCVPQAKASAIASRAVELSSLKSTTVRAFLSFLGSLTACKELLQWCMYHVRPLTRFVHRRYTPKRD